MQLGLALLVAARLAQPTPTDCSVALSQGIGTAAAQVCLGEAQERLAEAAAEESAGRERLLEAAVEHYRRAADLATNPDTKVQALEALARVYDAEHLDDLVRTELVLRELVGLQPNELEPLFRLAVVEEARGFLDNAETTLLSARQRHPDELQPLQKLAQFYVRRATAMHAAAREEAPSAPPPEPGQPDDDGAFRVGQGVESPRRLGNAVYPQDAKTAGIQGAVRAEILVNEEGLVTDARVVRSVPTLDDAALEAVREWRFEPAMIDGAAVPVKMEVTVNFTLR